MARKASQQVQREHLTDQQWADVSRMFSRLKELQTVARQRLEARK